MNKELKIMLHWSFLIMIIILICINLASIVSKNNLPQVTYYSQRLASNRLKQPNLYHSSETGKYPSSKNQHTKLMAIRKTNRLYVIANHRVLYIINAKINLKPTTTILNQARGEHAFNVNGKNQAISDCWTSFSKLGYLESPNSINGQHSKKNWLKNRVHLPNTIEVSQPDARWIQTLPKGTKLVVK